MSQEWNYMQCNQCYVMWPHLTVPEVCTCGNDLNCNSTRKKFFLSFKVEEIIDKFFDKAQKQINAHIKNFAIEGNRDIDPREKSLLLTIPITYRKKLKEEFTKEEVGA